MEYVYSASSNKFFPLSLRNSYVSQNSWPSDACKVTEDMMEFMGVPPTGKILATGEDGKPSWADIPEPTKEELIAAVEAERQWRVGIAMQSLILIRLKMDSGRELNADETAQRDAVLDYVDELNTINSNDAPNISWPEL